MTVNPNAPATIAAYIAAQPEAVRAKLESLRATIREVVPEAQEAIKYGIPTFVLHGNLVHFAAFKKHIGFYPTPSGMTEFAAELSRFKSGKGSAQFPLDEALPLELIRRIVAHRLDEVRAKRR